MTPVGFFDRHYRWVALVSLGVAGARAWVFLADEPAPATDARAVPLELDGTACRRLEPIGEPDPWAGWPDAPGVTGTCASQPLRVDSPWLTFAYAGHPSLARNRIGADGDGDDAVDLELATGGRALLDWQLTSQPLPDKFRNRELRLLIEDDSEGPQHWLALGPVVQSDGPIVTQPPRPLRRGLLTVLMLVLVSAALLVGRRGSHWRLWPLILATSAVMFLQLRTFYFWDDYTLLLDAVRGYETTGLIAYSGQFCPFFLWAHAALTNLTGGFYGPLQLLNITVHATTVVLLVGVLRRHGVARSVSTWVGLAYGVAYVHIDVVPWFMELVFTASTALSLAAVDQTVRYVQTGHRRSLAASVAFNLAAVCTFGGAAVMPFVCIAYVALFSPRDRRRLPIATLALTGSIGTASILAFAAGVAHGGEMASVVDMVGFVALGAIRGGVLAVVGMLDAPEWGAVALCLWLIGCGVLTRPSRRALRPLAFGGLWLAAAYTLQAVVRGHLGVAQAAALRYTYFGMTGGALVVSVLLAWGARAVRGRWPKLRSAALPVALVTLLLLTAHDIQQFSWIARAGFAEVHARNAQYFAVGRGRVAAGGVEGAPACRVPKSLHPNLSVADYLEIIADLSDSAVHPSPSSVAAHDALLRAGALCD